MRTSGNYSIPSAENKADKKKKRQTCAIRLYTVTLKLVCTHLEILKIKMSLADAETHTQTHTRKQTGIHERKTKTARENKKKHEV